MSALCLRVWHVNFSWLSSAVRPFDTGFLQSSEKALEWSNWKDTSMSLTMSVICSIIFWTFLPLPNFDFFNRPLEIVICNAVKPSLFWALRSQVLSVVSNSNLYLQATWRGVSPLEFNWLMLNQLPSTVSSQTQAWWQLPCCNAICSGVSFCALTVLGLQDSCGVIAFTRPELQYTAKIRIVVLTKTFVMWVAPVQLCPCFHPMYYTITTLPCHVAHSTAQNGRNDNIGSIMRVQFTWPYNSCDKGLF